MKSSRPRELPPQPLTDPDMSLSAHPAPIVQPMRKESANEQINLAVDGSPAEATAVRDAVSFLNA